MNTNCSINTSISASAHIKADSLKTDTSIYARNHTDTDIDTGTVKRCRSLAQFLCELCYHMFAYDLGKVSSTKAD